ncbi:MAG: rod shape-determining protein [Clostridia bacterium]|nr:rod shape-determining protein [Clostridia bacterium]
MFIRTIAADIGSVNTRLLTKEGLFTKRTLCAVDLKTGANIAAIGAAGVSGGNEASPIKRGAAANTELLAAFLSRINRDITGRRSAARTELVIALAQSMSAGKKLAFLKAAQTAGFRRCDIADASLMCAIGAGIDVFSDRAALVADIGAKTVKCAAVANGGVIFESAAEFGSDRVDEAIRAHFRDSCGVIIGRRTAEFIKIDPGAGGFTVDGRSVKDGLPRTVKAEKSKVEACVLSGLLETVRFIADSVRALSAEAAADIMDTGITLVGGGAMTRGLAGLISEETGVKTRVAEDAENALARGLKRAVFSEGGRLLGLFERTGGYIDTKSAR